MPVLPLPTPRTELLPLLRTLFDIALLRKGPQHIPDSLLVFGMAVGLWLFALLAGIVLVSSIDEAHFFPEILRVVALMAVYSGIVFARLERERRCCCPGGLVPGRFRRGRAVLRALVRPAPARRRLGVVSHPLVGDLRPVDRGPRRTGAAVTRHRHRRVRRGVPLHGAGAAYRPHRPDTGRSRCARTCRVP